MSEPISIDAHRKRGTFHNHRHADTPAALAEEPKPEQPKSRMPRPPPGVLGKVGRKEWRRVVKQHEHSGMFSDRDIAGLTQYCLLFQELCSKGEEFTAGKHAQLRLIAEALGISTVGFSRR